MKLDMADHTTRMKYYRELVEGTLRRVPDFPKSGINFFDIMPVLADTSAFAAACELHYDEMYSLPDRFNIDAVVGIESRGFIFGTLVADYLNCGFVPVRKPGKLPSEVASITYEKEYGTDTLEVQKDALKPGARVVVVDDLLATGGSAKAACDLLRGVGATVITTLFMIELVDLPGRAVLEAAGVPVRATLGL